MTNCVIHSLNFLLNVLISRLFLKLNVETIKITAELLEPYSFKDFGKKFGCILKSYFETSFWFPKRF